MKLESAIYLSLGAKVSHFIICLFLVVVTVCFANDDRMVSRLHERVGRRDLEEADFLDIKSQPGRGQLDLGVTESMKDMTSLIADTNASMWMEWCSDGGNIRTNVVIGLKLQNTTTSARVVTVRYPLPRLTQSYHTRPLSDMAVEYDSVTEQVFVQRDEQLNSGEERMFNIKGELLSPFKPYALESLKYLVSRFEGITNAWSSPWFSDGSNIRTNIVISLKLQNTNANTRVVTARFLLPRLKQSYRIRTPSGMAIEYDSMFDGIWVRRDEQLNSGEERMYNVKGELLSTRTGPAGGRL